MIRGGSGLYYTTPVSNMTFSPQILQPDGHGDVPARRPAGFIDGSPFITRSVLRRDDVRPGEGRGAAAGAAHHRPDYQKPSTWQSSIGFQKQINAVTGFEADLTHFNGYNDTRTIDPNLFFNPATGYNRNPAAISGVPNRPNPAYTQIAYFVSTGRRDQTQISTALNRRFKNNFQSGVTYTYMISMHDDGNNGYTVAGPEQPVRLPGRRVRDVNRLPAAHAARVDALSDAVGILDERVVFLRLGRALQRRRSRGRRTASPAPTA